MRAIRFTLASFCLAAAALASGACSEPVPLIPEGAWAVTFRDPGADCNVATHNSGVPAETAVGDSGEPELVVNGTEEAEVECEVSPSGGSFTFSGRVRYKGQYLSIRSSDLKAAATLDEPSTGTVEFQTVKTSAIYSSDACNLYFLPDSGQGIEAGNVWGSFQCPSVGGAAGDVCEVQQGYFAFENCLGSQTEEE